MSRHEIRLEAGRVERADRLLARALAGLSRRTVQRLLAEGRITLDGRPVRKGDLLRGERLLVVEVLAPASLELAPEGEPALPILYEDDSCVAVDKPAGRSGHALRPAERGTVANFLVARFPECAGAGGSPLEAGLVHRLDTETSGLLLAARSQEAWQALRGQFRDRRVGKRYLAVVHGAVGGPGEIHRAIEAAHRRRVRVLGEGESAAGARPAITRYRPRRSASHFTLLEVEIPTGVLHQIRAHLSAAGHPVVGDELYGAEAGIAPRQLLHAASLEFDRPRDARRIRVESPLPPDFRAMMSRLGFATDD